MQFYVFEYMVIVYINIIYVMYMSTRICVKCNDYIPTYLFIVHLFIPLITNYY